MKLWDIGSNKPVFQSKLKERMHDIAVLAPGLTLPTQNSNKSVLMSAISSKPHNDQLLFFEVADKSFKQIKSIEQKIGIYKAKWLPSALWNHNEEHKIDTNYLFVCDEAQNILIYNVQFTRTSGLINKLSVTLDHKFQSGNVDLMEFGF